MNSEYNRYNNKSDFNLGVLKKPISYKYCYICGRYFVVKHPIQKTCSSECSHEYNRIMHIKWYHKNKIRENKKWKRYYIKNKNKIKENRKKYILRNKERLRYKKKIYDIKHREIRNKVRNIKYKNDTIYKYNAVIRSSLKNSFKNINKSKNMISTNRLLSFSTKELKKHLEKQFDAHMNHNNYGIYWDIGHRIPLSWFNTKTELLSIGWNIKNIFPVECNFNRNIQRDKFAYINNKKIFDKDIAIRELFGDDK
jgi:hypothetical protein